MSDRRQLAKMSARRARLLNHLLRIEDQEFKEWATDNDIAFARDIDRIMSERDAYISKWMN